MKQFVLGSAFLMFISSLPADATNNHAISLKPQLEPQKVAFMPSYGDTLPPIGYVNFCQVHNTDCRPSGRFADRVQLSASRLRELDKINRSVNQEIAPVTDMQLYGKVEYWTYPDKRKEGDCEDYVLLKRRILIQRGWPESTLLITVVRDENNVGHAVLTVRTARGDLVLDNKRSDIRLWTDTPYTYVKRQSSRNPLVWISLLPPDLAPQPQVSSSWRADEN